MPKAATVSVGEVLALFDGPFSSVANGVAEARYALWLGSGISLDRVEGLKGLLVRALEYLHSRRAVDDASCKFARAMHEIVALSRRGAEASQNIEQRVAPAEWDFLGEVVSDLVGKYAQVLDVRVEGEPSDFLLWDAVDVRTTYASDAVEPDCEHLAVAWLALEGHAPEIPSANWDGLVEAAVQQLNPALEDLVQVCVQPGDLRGPSAKTRLLKYHGCAIRAAAEPDTYRHMLIHQKSQIARWPYNPDYTAMRNELVSLATRLPTLMIGLSAQDSDIQDVFAAAAAGMEWPWPSNPPACVFAEDVLGADQGTILRNVYRTAYESSAGEIDESALLRAFAKPLLVALVLHVLAAKLTALAELADTPHLSSVERNSVVEGLKAARDLLAAEADGDRREFIVRAAEGIGRTLSQFRGNDDSGPGHFQPLTGSPAHLLATDAHIPFGGLPELSMAVGLLGRGATEGIWELSTSDHGATLAVASPAGSARVAFVATPTAALKLEVNGVIDSGEGDVVVIHSGELVLPVARSPRAAPGRTGYMGARNVGMGPLLREADGLQDLEARFREESLL